MAYIIAGLGNPEADRDKKLKKDEENYEGTRHNTGRMVVKDIFDTEFSYDKKINALVADVKIGKEKVKLVLPETYMNNSGKAIAQLVKSVKAAEKLVVIYDDFNLPIGTVRISFNRSSGGHNGLESIIKSIKTEAFIRIRIGIAPETVKGTAKVPHGDDKVEKFILGKFKDDEIKELNKVEKRVKEGIDILIKEGKDKAMSMVNAG